MFLHRSNRTENLVETLAHVLRAYPLDDPLAREHIVVEGRGIERWLAHQLADRLGVWANADFPFPRHFLRDACFHPVLQLEADCTARFEPEALTWAVAAHLPELCSDPGFAEVEAYLARDPSSGRLLALSHQLARLFDQYATYRPEMILGWRTQRPDDPWQAVLWRRLVDALGEHHIAACAERFPSAVDSAPLAALPSRVVLFGLSTLPPLYLEVLAALSRRVQVHLFLLSPSDQYWGDIRSRREILRAARFQEIPDLEAELVARAGHPLLASLGAVGRDFQAVLESRVDYEEYELPGYVTPPKTSVLGTLQADILELRPPAAGGAKRVLAPDDNSVQLHRCHGPMREVEALHQLLRRAFEDDPSLRADDVVVQCPEIDTYAPLIDAVFGTFDGRAALPYRIADRSVRSGNEVVAGFLRVLVVLEGRLPATDVADLLEVRPIRERFGLTEADGESITTWLRAAAVRWGADAAHRAEVGQPALEQNTWRFGLERLFLGYAMASAAGRTFCDRAPAIEIDGSMADVLGGLAQFCEALFRWRSRLRLARSPQAWATTLSECLAELIDDTPETYGQRQRIRDALVDAARQADDAGFTADLDLAAVRRWVEQALERSAPGRGFAGGGITFCALVPMRSVPYRIVCLLGMNDETFPRRDTNPAFDLMAVRPRPGDRSRRADDRYLFLEALLAARERLIITCVGRSLRDNEKLPPSVVVTELLDAIDATFEPQASTPHALASDALTIDHPLHAFSPRYFDGSDRRLINDGPAAFAAAHALVASTRPGRPPFLSDALPPLGEPILEISVDRLCRFLRNPAQAFAADRLGITLRVRESELEDREPLELDPLERWQLATTLLSGPGTADASGSPVAEARLRATGELPPGALGSSLYAAIDSEVEAIRRHAAEQRCEPALEPITAEATIAGIRLHGTIDQLWPEGRVVTTYSRFSGRVILDAWVRHLFLNLIRPEHCAHTSFLIARDEKTGVASVRFQPVAEPLEALEPLVRLYLRGFEIPIPFFPGAGFVFARTLGAEGLAQARRRARDAFHSSHAGEGDDEAIRLVFGDDEPLPTDPTYPLYASEDRAPLRFEHLALAVFAPLLGHIDMDVSIDTAEADA